MPQAIARGQIEMRRVSIDWFSSVATIIVLFVSVSASAGELEVKKTSCTESQLRGLWRLEGRTWTVFVNSKFDRELGACSRSLRILDDAGASNGKTVFVEEMAEYPIAIWPVNQRLLTLWGSGSAFWVVVYSSINGRVRKVLDVRPKGLPEIVFSKDGSERLIFASYELERSAATGTAISVPRTADIYRWANGQYVAQKFVSWARRFEEPSDIGASPIAK